MDFKKKELSTDIKHDSMDSETPMLYFMQLGGQIFLIDQPWVCMGQRIFIKKQQMILHLPYLLIRSFATLLFRFSGALIEARRRLSRLVNLSNAC